MHRNNQPCPQSFRRTMFFRNGRKMKVEYYLRSGFMVSLFMVSLLMCALTCLGQQSGSGGALRGQVTDPSGAAISGASVIMTPATGSPIVVQSNGQGMYEFKSVPAGKYALPGSAPGFTPYENNNVVVARQGRRLGLSLIIAAATQQGPVSHN